MPQVMLRVISLLWGRGTHTRVRARSLIIAPSLCRCALNQWRGVATVTSLSPHHARLGAGKQHPFGTMPQKMLFVVPARGLALVVALTKRGGGGDHDAAT